MEFETRATTTEEYIQYIQDRLDSARHVIANTQWGDYVEVRPGDERFFHCVKKPDKVIEDEFVVDNQCIDSFLQEFNVAEIV